MVTREYIKSILHYCPETGVFTWLKSRPGVKVGGVAGSLCKKGYMHIGIDGKSHRSHRLAFLYMTGKFPEDQTDHINHNTSDNRWLNIRLATASDNMKNKSVRKDNTSGVCGVYWDKKSAKWHSEIRNKGRKYSLGRFEELKDAIAARKSGEEKYNFHINHGNVRNGETKCGSQYQ